MTRTALWDVDERAAWNVPEKLKPSEWAERYRELGPGQSNIPGPWRNDVAPYLRGIMDLAVAPGVVQLNIQKAGQMGVSEALRNLMGYWAHMDPDPIGLTLPDRVKGRAIVSNRVIPMFETTPALTNLFTAKSHDIKKEQIKLVNGFLMHLMWAGSESSTASDPMRRVINDEVDKPGFLANAIGATETRITTYEERRLQLNASTPTNRFGKIFGLVEDSDYVLHFVVPCPHCGGLQKLVFRQLKWKHSDARERKDRAALVRKAGNVWYECIHCQEKITREHKAAMIRAGRYATDDGEIEDAEAVEQWPAETRLGIRLSSLYCDWKSWERIAAQCILAQGDPSRAYIFRTETLGEVWEEQMDRTKPSLFSLKCKRATLAEGIVPRWAVKIITSIDTQHDHFWLVHRAWGPNMRSQRVFHGRVETFEQLDELCFRRPWEFEDNAHPPLLPELIGIDSGGTQMAGESASRTQQVYRWAWRRRARVRALKGASHTKRKDVFIWPGKGNMSEGLGDRKRNVRQLQIWYLNTNHFQDLLAELIRMGADRHAGENDDEAPEQEELWLLNQRDDEEYNWHLSNMHKIAVQKGAVIEQQWMPLESGARIDLRDCEVYNLAVAHMAYVHLLPSDDEVARMREQAKTGAPRRRRQSSARRNAWDVKPWKK